MDDLIQELQQSAMVLDLGSGGGSFSYHSTRARVIAYDLAFPAIRQPAFARILGDSRRLPFPDNSIDVVVCNHTLEHFQYVEDTILEIDRILKLSGRLWAAIPDGFSLDDRLYRYLFEGGGHVNRFSLESFLKIFETNSSLRAVRCKTLHSGFVYLNPPDPEKLIHYPARARHLARIPPQALRFLLRWANYQVRWADKLLGTSLSHYGWGIVFSRCTSSQCNPGELTWDPEDLNVCFSCGSGHPRQALLPRLNRRALWKTYQCANCGTENLFFNG